MHRKNLLEMTCPECGQTFQITRNEYQELQTEYASEIYCPNCQFQKFFGDVHSE